MGKTSKFRTQVARHCFANRFLAAPTGLGVWLRSFGNRCLHDLHMAMLGPFVGAVPMYADDEPGSRREPSSHTIDDE